MFKVQLIRLIGNAGKNIFYLIRNLYVHVPQKKHTLSELRKPKFNQITFLANRDEIIQGTFKKNQDVTNSQV